MIRRSKLEVYLDLMRAISVDGNPIHIAEKVSLPMSDIRKHLEFLSSQGFMKVKIAGGGAEYELTRRRHGVLEALRGLTEHKPAISPKAIV